MAIRYETELYSLSKLILNSAALISKPRLSTATWLASGQIRIIPYCGDEKTFNLSLLLQGMQRLKLSPLVYLAVERNRSKRGAVNQRWSELTALCRQLGWGYGPSPLQNQSASG